MENLQYRRPIENQAIRHTEEGQDDTDFNETLPNINMPRGWEYTEEGAAAKDKLWNLRCTCLPRIASIRNSQCSLLPNIVLLIVLAIIGTVCYFLEAIIPILTHTKALLAVAACAGGMLGIACCTVCRLQVRKKVPRWTQEIKDEFAAFDERYPHFREEEERVQRHVIQEVNKNKGKDIGGLLRKLYINERIIAEFFKPYVPPDHAHEDE